jgi:hypothetical protein
MSLSLNNINQFVLKKQYLSKSPKDVNFVDIINNLYGLHATVPTTPYLSLFARLNNFTKQDLDNELYIKRNLGKIRFVRKTVYVLSKNELSTAFSATKEMIGTISMPHLFEYLGVSHNEYRIFSKKIIEILKENAMTTKEIKKEIDKSKNISGIVNLMCDQGLLIRGKPKSGWKSNIHNYHLFNDLYPDVNLNSVDETEAQKKVVRKYIHTFEPVTENDIRWWTGFKKGVVREILDDFNKEITQIDIDGLQKKYLMFEQNMKILDNIHELKEPIINLLPKLDNYIMGYKDRQRYLDDTFYEYIFDRSGNATNIIMMNGKIIGVWDFIEPVVKLFLFEHVKPLILEIILSKAKKIGNFIFEKPVKVEVVDQMVSLLKRTAGGFLSPLKNS